MSREWIEGEHHVSISGQTGAGKTHLANEIHKSLGKSKQRLSIFLNTQHERYIHGYKCRSVRDIKKRLKQGVGRYGLCFNYLPASTTGEREHAEITKWIMGSDTPVLLVTDEAHEIAPQGADSSTLHRSTKRGRRYQVKNLVVSQRPSSVSKDVLTQCRYHCWLGKPSAYELDYLKARGFPVEQMKSANKHEITVVSGGETVARYPQGV